MNIHTLIIAILAVIALSCFSWVFLIIRKQQLEDLARVGGRSFYFPIALIAIGIIIVVMLTGYGLHSF